MVHHACRAVVLLVASAPLGAQVARGVTDSVASLTDPTQVFATFVPSSYREGVPAPLLIVMDPRGRALVPLERLRPAAEELGYLVISSYDTRSDTDRDVTERAVGAMIDDAQDLFTVDTRRLYFVGFSGTARMAWIFGRVFAPYTAGIIGFGAALPSPATLVELTAQGPLPFAFFGGAGELDFNYEEVRELDARLDAYDAPHFVSFYAGPHAWPADSIFTHALEWLEVRAVRTGLRPERSDDVQELHDRALARASALEEAGKVEGAWRSHGRIVIDFDGLVDVRASRAAMARLEGSPALADERRRLERELEARKAFDVDVGRWLEAVRRTLRARAVERGIEALDLDGLLREAREAESPHDRRAAQRKLSSVFVRASFYEPDRYMRMEEYGVAAAFHRLATRIRPDDPRACLGLARASTQAGEVDDALDAVDCLARSGAMTAEALRSDALLEPLLGEERFEAALRRLGG